MRRNDLILLLGLTSVAFCANFCPWGNNPVCGVDYITYEN